MELKVGMYIRTRDENISKIKYINKFIYTDKQRYGKHYIEKASEKARKEAIELIKELYDNTDDTTCYDIDKDEKERLLQILDIDKGE